MTHHLWDCESHDNKECTCKGTVQDLLKGEYWLVMQRCTNLEYDCSVILNNILDGIIKKFGHYKVIKTETHYSTAIDMGKNGVYGKYFEDLDVIQSNDSAMENKIKVKIFEERWRTPEDTVKFLKKVTEIIEKEFIKK